MSYTCVTFETRSRSLWLVGILTIYRDILHINILDKLNVNLSVTFVTLETRDGRPEPLGLLFG